MFVESLSCDRAGEVALEDQNSEDEPEEDLSGAKITISDAYRRALLERAASLGDGAACAAIYKLVLLRNSATSEDSIEPTNANVLSALHYMRRAVALGDAGVIDRIAKSCQGASDPGTRALAAQSYRRLEEPPVLWLENCSDIWIELGEAYETGESFMPRDLRRAAAMYARLSSNPNYSHYFGCLLRDGRGVPQDLARARELFSLGSEGKYVDGDNNVDAHRLLAESCMHGGAGIDVDIPRAIAAYKRFIKNAESDHEFFDRTLWDLILALLRSGKYADAAAWSAAAYNGVRTIDWTKLDAYAACEALLIVQSNCVKTRGEGDSDRARSRFKRVLRKQLSLPLNEWSHGAVEPQF
jgi:TPR repeat protein